MPVYLRHLLALWSLIGLLSLEEFAVLKWSELRGHPSEECARPCHGRSLSLSLSLSLPVPTIFCFTDTCSVIFVACHIDGDVVGSPIAVLVIFLGEGWC